MYGVLREYQVNPQDVDEIVRRAEDGFARIVRSVPGFVSYSILDAGDGRAITFGTFQDRAGAEESTLRAAVWVRENLATLLPTPPRVTAGELPVRTVAEGPKYGVIRRYTVDPRNMDEAIRRAETGFLPLVRGLPGFAAYVILNDGNGTLISLSGFATREQAEASTRSAGAWVQENLGPLMPNPPKVVAGEVKLRVVAEDSRTERNKALFRLLLDELNKGNIDVVDEVIGPDAVIRLPLSEPQQGREVFREMFGAAYRALESRYTLDEIICEGDSVAARFTNHGKHSGEFLGQAPTGHSIESSVVVIYHVAGGQIADYRLSLEMHEMLPQFGTAPAAAVAAG